MRFVLGLAALIFPGAVPVRAAELGLPAAADPMLYLIA
jgi:hypothetical protein